MAIAEFLEMGGPASAGEVTDVMNRAAAAHRLTDEEGARFDGSGAFLSSGAWASVRASSPLPFRDPVEELFGFDPTVTVLFRHNKGYDPIRRRQAIIRLVAAVLTEVSGDVFFAFEREITRLVRLSGRLTISEAEDYWCPEVVTLLPPHDRAALPNM